MRPEYRAQGDDHLVLWPEHGVAMEFSRVRETDSSVYAVVRAVAITEGNYGKLLFAPVRVNLWEMTARKRLAEELALATKARDADWKLAVEYAYRDVLDAITKVEPLQTLAEVPLPTRVGHSVYPVAMRDELNILYADGKSGKSYNMLRLAVAVCTGLVELEGGFLIHDHGPVILYDTETNERTQRLRFERVCAGLGLRQLPKNLHYRCLAGRTIPHSATLMRREVDQIKPALVLVDSITFGAGGDLNKTEIAEPVVAALKSLQVTVLASAHHSKAGRQDGDNASVMGSSLFEFGARSLFLLRRVSSPGMPYIDTVWTQKAINDAPTEPPFALRMSFSPANDKVTWEVRDITEDEALARQGGTHEQRLIAALRACDDWTAKNSDLAKMAGLDPEVARITLSRSKLVERVGPNKPVTWTLLEPVSHTQNANGVHHGGNPTTEQTLKKERCWVGSLVTTTQPNPTDPTEQTEHVGFSAESGDEVERDLPF